MANPVYELFLLTIWELNFEQHNNFRFSCQSMHRWREGMVHSVLCWQKLDCYDCKKYSNDNVVHALPISSACIVITPSRGESFIVRSNRIIGFTFSTHDSWCKNVSHTFMLHELRRIISKKTFAIEWKSYPLDFGRRKMHAKVPKPAPVYYENIPTHNKLISYFPFDLKKARSRLNLDV